MSGTPVDLTVTLTPDGISAQAATSAATPVEAVTNAVLPRAQHPERTAAAVEKAFARLGGTDWSLRNLTLLDPDHLFAPASLLNDLRRALVERLDAARDAARARKIAAALSSGSGRACRGLSALTTLKQRLDQPLPADAARYDEIVLALGHLAGRAAESALAPFAGLPVRLALPVFTHERDFHALRTAVKYLLRAGFTRWEASDLATLRLLRQTGVTDLTADWTIYAFNRAALAELGDLGVARTVASPENTPENLAFLAQGSLPVECLEQQSTPLFISLTPPALGGPQLVAAATTGDTRSCATFSLTSPQGAPFTTFPLDGLWITTRAAPRRFTPPAGTARRLDLSWDPLPKRAEV